MGFFAELRKDLEQLSTVEGIEKIALNAVEEKYSKLEDLGFIMGYKKISLADRLNNMEKNIEDINIKLNELKQLYYSSLTQSQLFDMFKYKRFCDLELDISNAFNDKFDCHYDGKRKIADCNSVIMDLCIQWGLYKEGKFIPDKEV